MISMANRGARYGQIPVVCSIASWGLPWVDLPVISQAPRGSTSRAAPRQTPKPTFPTWTCAVLRSSTFTGGHHMIHSTVLRRTLRGKRFVFLGAESVFRGEILWESIEIFGPSWTIFGPSWTILDNMDPLHGSAIGIAKDPFGMSEILGKGAPPNSFRSRNGVSRLAMEEDVESAWQISIAKLDPALKRCAGCASPRGWFAWWAGWT